MAEWGLLISLTALLAIALIMVFYPLRCFAKRFFLILTPLIISFVVFAYFTWGGFFAWDNYLKQQTRQTQVEALLKTVKGPQEIIDKLKSKLEENPNSARGWYLLGRLYSSQNQWQLAHEAFTKAYELQPTNEPIVVNYAQSLWQLNHRAFNDDIRQHFESILKRNNKQPDALAMLAMDAYIRQSYHQAIIYWQRLLAIVPPESKDAEAIRKAIAKAAAAVKTQPLLQGE
jgi:cytochrome c-type biogenesis protein CcmH/NrfG